MNTIPIRPFAALKLITLIALALMLLLLNACRWVGVKGDGNITTDQRTVPDFHTLVADGAFEVNWTSGAPAFSITTDRNLLEYLRTDVSDGRLQIEWIKPLKGTRGIKINTASAALKRVELNGAVRFVAANLSGPELYLQGDGATRVALNGAVNAMSAEMNGASRLDADTLVARAIELSISGAGRAEVHATEILKVEISGAGKVIYSGNPKTVDKDVSGAGSIKPRD